MEIKMRGYWSKPYPWSIVDTIYPEPILEI